MNSGTDLLKLIFIGLTESGTEKTVTIRADLIGIIKESTRGHTDIYVDIKLDGINVIQVTETKDEIIKGLAEAFLQLKKQAREIK